MSQRLASTAAPMLAGDPDTRRAAIERFSRQVDDDADTVARWARRPDTAPAYGVSELKLDKRVTVYSRWGDWFAQGALALYLVMVLDWFLRRLASRRAGAATSEGSER